MLAGAHPTTEDATASVRALAPSMAAVVMIGSTVATWRLSNPTVRRE
jgi:hypothetical protein